MSLLREIESKPRSKVILGAIIKMAKELGMNVVTEGVETAEQLKALQDMGCDRFQGYFFHVRCQYPNSNCSNLEKTIMCSLATPLTENL